MTLVSVQPFGLQAPGGGSRILRSLYGESATPVVSLVTDRTAPPAGDSFVERHLPLRPSLGPIDGSRYDHWSAAVELLAAPLAARRIVRTARAHNARAIHSVAHSPAFWPAYEAARAMRIPYLLTVHDDLRYLLRHMPLRGLALSRLGRAWRGADARFVISAPLGEEYSERYGAAPYEIVTDGVTEADFLGTRGLSDNRLRVYFAGLFHLGYTANFRSLMSALDQIGGLRPRLDVAMTCRCGSVPEWPEARTPLEVRPFGPPQVVREELGQSDLLYLPLMLDEHYRDMIAFSLSTKLVTYLASGVPILYHGPPVGAAYELLAEHDAAILATTNEPQVLAQTVLDGMGRASTLIANARALARRQFMLADQRDRFWRAVPA